MTLYLVATPIGNLKDISHRALEVLGSVRYILCEDTRHSHILLHHYGIETPRKSFHAFNEREREEAILHDLKSGIDIAMISDAGTPGICDPGEALVRRCFEEKIAVTAIPGPSALTAALSLVPFPKERVQFLGFLSKKSSDLQRELVRALLYDGLSIFYDTPHHIETTVDSIARIDPHRSIALFRELTKKFEEIVLLSAAEMVLHLKAKPPRGEMVIAVPGIPPKEDEDLKELVGHLCRTYGISLAEAIKTAAELQGIPRKEVYKTIHR
jgi:16S rRNA (cytidine1402-2'-O)-methyltransferase